MNFSKIRRSPLAIAAGAGFLGFALRALLYRIGFDDKNILSASHPLHLICMVLTAAVAVYLVIYALRSREQMQEHPRTRFGLGLAGSYFTLIHSITLFSRGLPILELLHFSLAVASAVAMAVAVFPCLKDSRVHMVCHGIISVGFALDMLCRYQVWSGNPQLPDYCFHVLAGVALSLGAYHTLALFTGPAKPRAHRFCCLAGLYLCLLCLIGPDPWEFYLGGAFWAAACLLCPQPPVEEAAEDKPEEETDVPA